MDKGEGSFLRREIAAVLGEHARYVVFDTFTCSGHNSHKTSIQAGYELADHIRALRQKGVPARRHFIIAHSHGGNVALFDHKHLEDDQHVLWIATLGTLFLHSQLRGDLKWKGSRWYEHDMTTACESLTAFFMFIVFLVLMLTVTPALTGRTEYPLGWAFALANTIPIVVRRPFHRYLSQHVTWLWNIINGRCMAARSLLCEFAGV